MNTPEKEHISIDQLRQEHLKTNGFISAIKGENNRVSPALAVIIKEVGQARVACEESRDVLILKTIIEEVENISRASQGIELLLQSWTSGNSK